jgi:hypothetical protein
MKPIKPRDKQSRTAADDAAVQQEGFAEIAQMIQAAREQTLAAESLADPPVFRRLPRPTGTLDAVERTAVVRASAYPRQDKAPGRTSRSTWASRSP